MFDRHSPAEVDSEKVTRQLQARLASPDKRTRRYMAIDGKSFYRNGWRFIEHRAKSPCHCNRAVAKGLDRRCFDGAVAIRLRSYRGTRRVGGAVVVVVLGVPGIVVVVVVVGAGVVVVVVVGIVAW